MQVDRRALIGLGAGLAAAGAASAAQSARFTPPDDAAAGFASKIAGVDAAMVDIDAYVGQHLAAHSLPGLTLAVVTPDGGSAIFQRGYADVDRRIPVGPDHLFQIGSISKSFTALCIFRLMQAGRLRLEDEVLQILPEVPLPKGGRITVQSLLNHSSGLADDPPMFPRGGGQRLWQGFPAGAQWSYSNLGYALLSTIVERVDGRLFRDALHGLVLEPLAMHSTRSAIVTAERARYATGYSPLYGDRAYPRGGPLAPGSWTNMVEGSGCVASTAADMAIYMRYLIQAARGRGAPLLSDANALRFCRATIDAPGWATPDSKYANGLAVVKVGGRELLHHTGGMLLFNSSIHLDPIAGVGAFASTNVGLIPYRPRGLTAFACERLRAAVEGARPTPAPPVVAPLPDLSEIHGRYAARDGAILELGPSSRGLVATLGGRSVPMEPAAPDAFIAVDPSAAAHPLVLRRVDKAVVRAWWGDSEYVRLRDGAPAAAFSPRPPPAVAALVGRYENDDPWRGGFTITAQGRDLFADGITPLVPLPGGGFRLGEKNWSPERVAFDAPIGGRPQRANASGVDYLRRVT